MDDSHKTPPGESSLPPPSPTPPTLTFQITLPGQRLDLAIVAHQPDLSRSLIQRLIKTGDVLVNEKTSKAAYRVDVGDRVTLKLPSPAPSTIEAEDIPLKVLYEDADLIALDKVAGMVVHPATGHQSGTLVNAALARWPQLREIGGSERAGVVHRLDKDTSGVILLAKTPAAFAHLQQQFKERLVQKRYLALVEGLPESSEGKIDAPIGRSPRDRKRMAVIRGGREAITRYQLLQPFEDHALLEVHPQTGRTHQIRVHLAWLRHPIVGDRVYGQRKQRINLNRQWLHAANLTIRAPSGQQSLAFEAPLPSELQAVLDSLA